MSGITRLLRNFVSGRLFLAILCFILAAICAFVLLPGLYRDQQATVQLVRVKERIQAGERIESRLLEMVEVGAYNLPAETIVSLEEVVGQYATTLLLPGDLFAAAKISPVRLASSLDLVLAARQQLVTVTPKNAAQVLAAHLKPGDVVAVAVLQEERLPSGEIERHVAFPECLQTLRIYAVENARGQVLAGEVAAESALLLASAQSSNEDLIPKTITFIVDPQQADLLLTAEYGNGFHLIFRERRP